MKHLPEKNRGRTGKWICKPVEQEENHGKDLRWSWARSHMGKGEAERAFARRLHAGIFSVTAMFAFGRFFCAKWL
jgi:hypothetical protein